MPRGAFVTACVRCVFAVHGFVTGCRKNAICESGSGAVQDIEPGVAILYHLPSDCAGRFRVLIRNGPRSFLDAVPL